MSEFSRENVTKARARIPRTDSRTVSDWAERGRQHGLDDFVAACVQELALRGPIKLGTSQAERHADWTARTRTLSLQNAVRFAFEQREANADETKLVQLIAAQPGISHSEIIAAYGKRDVGLVIGHLVYERYGCFKPWIEDTKRMSDILFLNATTLDRASDTRLRWKRGPLSPSSA